MPDCRAKDASVTSGRGTRLQLLSCTSQYDYWSLSMSASLTNDPEELPADDFRLARCQVDVSFPSGYKTGPQPHCPWFGECNGSPQIIEVKDTGWETYHFKTVADATRFAKMTRQRVAD